MVVSDLHYDMRIFRGVDESKAWEWLLSIVDYHKPDLLLSCGDWGTAINFEEFYKLLKKTVVLTIHGNHENMDVLTKIYNIRTNNYLPILMEDGKVYELYGLRIAGINGIIAVKRKVKKGVPRKTPDEFIEYAKKLDGRGIDILLIHETPYLPELFPSMRYDCTSRTALEAVRVVKPRLVFNGHMHHGEYKLHGFKFGTKYVYIDSSQQHRCYAILHPSKARIEFWIDDRKVEEANI